MNTCRKTIAAAAASRMASTGLMLAMLFMQALALPVSAAPFRLADEARVRSAVEGQLAAFAEDDAVKAFSYAAPAVRKAVGSAAGFLAMVRRDYPVVYRPASVAFLSPEGKQDEAVQRVQMLDGKGNSWLAVYSLERFKGNVWRITGCAVVENKGRMA